MYAMTCHGILVTCINIYGYIYVYTDIYVMKYTDVYVMAYGFICDDVYHVMHVPCINIYNDTRY